MIENRYGCCGIYSTPRFAVAWFLGGAASAAAGAGSLSLKYQVYEYEEFLSVETRNILSIFTNLRAATIYAPGPRQDFGDPGLVK